jgi:hypothetical protein
MRSISSVTDSPPRIVFAYLATAELGLAVCRVANTALYGIGVTHGIYQYEDWIQQFSCTVIGTGRNLFVGIVSAIGILFPETIDNWCSE